MASVLPIAVAVLAAGQSRRFGEAEKLSAEFRGKPLGLHACETLAPLPFAKRWVVTSSEEHSCAKSWRDAGFDPLPNPAAESGIGSSLSVAAQHARDAGMTGLLIALADMPLVPASHFANLIERASRDTLRASHNGDHPTPPAMFGATHFAALDAAAGDEGARKLIRRADFVDCPSRLLVDIDTPEALTKLG